jgi:DNA invertase Pin-like site-specific DNA recombinase
MKQAITYYRVSTERQGKSGLGLEAQQSMVSAFAGSNGFNVVAEFTEVESGKKDNRPVLLAALASCRANNAVLLIAKLDRLGRNVAFISALMQSGVEFKAVDNPYAGKFMVHIMAAVAEHEREQISERTTAALQAAKLRGVELGKNGKYVLSKLNKVLADGFAWDMKPIIDSVRLDGFTTVRQIAKELNRLQIPTYRQTKWHPTTVHQLLQRIGQTVTT